MVYGLVLEMVRGQGFETDLVDVFWREEAALVHCFLGWGLPSVPTAS